MDTNKALILLALASVIACPRPAHAQMTGQTVRHHRVEEEQDP